MIRKLLVMISMNICRKELTGLWREQITYLQGQAARSLTDRPDSVKRLEKMIFEMYNPEIGYDKDVIMNPFTGEPWFSRIHVVPQIINQYLGPFEDTDAPSGMIYSGIAAASASEHRCAWAGRTER